MQQLLKNKLTFFSLLLLILLSIVTGLAYLIIPDKTTNANRQLPLVALSGPGTSQQFLVTPKNITVKEKGIFHTLINGKRDHLEYTPYDTFYIENGQLLSSFRSSVTIHPSEIQLIDVQEKELVFIMGTDKYGRDIWSRLILGLRISLFVGFLSVLVSITLGIGIGSIGGYYGGWIDRFIMLLINTSWSIPTLLMAFAIIIALGKGFLVIVLAVGLTMWVDVARIVRGQVLQIKNELFVKASRVMGFNDFRIISRHILPNITGTILVMAAANFATAILVEAGLSYLGLGIQPPMPSLGNMLQESYAYATGGFVYLAIFPIIAIMTLVLCFNLLGTGLRDLFDIKSIQT